MNEGGHARLHFCGRRPTTNSGGPCRCRCVAVAAKQSHAKNKIIHRTGCAGQRGRGPPIQQGQVDCRPAGHLSPDSLSLGRCRQNHASQNQFSCRAVRRCGGGRVYRRNPCWLMFTPGQSIGTGMIASWPQFWPQLRRGPWLVVAARRWPRWSDTLQRWISRPRLTSLTPARRLSATWPSPSESLYPICAAAASCNRR